MIEFTLEISNWNFENQLTALTKHKRRINKYLQF